jgi:hypothetical protein
MPNTNETLLTERTYLFCMDVIQDLFGRWYNWGVGREMSTRRSIQTMVSDLEKIMVCRDPVASSNSGDHKSNSLVNESFMIDNLFGGARRKECRLWFKDVFFDGSEKRIFLTLLADYINTKVLGVNSKDGVFGSVSGKFKVVKGFTRQYTKKYGNKEIGHYPMSHTWLEATLSEGKFLVLDVFTYNPSYLKTKEMEQVLFTSLRLPQQVFPEFIERSMDMLILKGGELSLSINIRDTVVYPLPPGLPLVERACPGTLYIPYHTCLPPPPPCSPLKWQCCTKNTGSCFSCRLIQKRGLDRSCTDGPVGDVDVVLSTLTDLYGDLVFGEFVWDILVRILEPFYMLREMFFFVDTVDADACYNMVAPHDVEIPTKLDYYIGILKTYAGMCINISRAFTLFGRHVHWKKTTCKYSRKYCYATKPPPTFEEGALTIVSRAYDHDLLSYSSMLRPLFEPTRWMQKRINVCTYRRLWVLVHMITTNILLPPTDGMEKRRAFFESFGICKISVCPGDDDLCFQKYVGIPEKMAARFYPLKYPIPSASQSNREILMSICFTSFFSEWTSGKELGSTLSKYLHQNHPLHITRMDQWTQIPIHLRLLQPFNSHTDYALSTYIQRTFDGFTASMFKIFQYFSLLQRIHAWPPLRELYMNKKVSFHAFQRLFYQLHTIRSTGDGKEVARSVFKHLSMDKIDNMLAEHQRNVHIHLKTAFTILLSHIPDDLGKNRQQKAAITIIGEWKNLLQNPLLRFVISSSSSRLLCVGIDNDRAIGLLKLTSMVSKLVEE